MNNDAIIEFSKSAPLRRQLTAEDWWVVSRHALFALWAILFFVFTAQLYEAVATALIAGVTVGLVLIGSLVAAAGRLTFRHKSLEFAGLTGVVFGTSLYMVLVIVQILTIDQNWQRLAVLALAGLVLDGPLERWLKLGHDILVDAGYLKQGVRIRRRMKAKKK